MIGSVLVVLIIFLFLRNFRSTLIVCTAIPISVIGTFALLYFGGLTLNTMTFGGLALGVGMIVDAAIVVLENSFRHMEHHGKDRMAARDGHRSTRVRSTAARKCGRRFSRRSSRTSPVFVPAALPRGRLEHALPAAVDRGLLLPADVALRGGDPRAGAVLAAARPAAAAGKAEPDRRHACYTFSEAVARRHGRGYKRPAAPRAEPPRDGWSLTARRDSVVAAMALILPTLPTELATQADEGQVQVSVELAQGTRIEITDPVLQRIEASLRELVPEATDVITSAGSGGGPGGPGGSNSVSRGQLQLLLKPKDERTRSSDQIAMELRRQLAGIPGVVVRASAAGGNNQLNRFLSGGKNGGGRLSLEIRGESLNDARQGRAGREGSPRHGAGRCRRPPGPRRCAAGARGAGRSREGGALRPERAPTVANTTSANANVAGEQAALFRQGGQEYPIIVRLKEDQRQGIADVSDVLVSTPQGQVVQAKNLMRVEDAVGPSQIQRKNQQRIAYVSAEPEATLSDSVVSAIAGPAAADSGAHPEGLQRSASAPEVEQQARGLRTAADGADPRARPRLRGHGVAVRIAARSLHHHVLRPHGRDRRRAGAEADRHVVQHAGLHRHHHAGGDRRQ